jgi:hypothetical protein
MLGGAPKLYLIFLHPAHGALTVGDHPYSRVNRSAAIRKIVSAVMMPARASLGMERNQSFTTSVASAPFFVL